MVGLAFTSGRPTEVIRIGANGRLSPTARLLALERDPAFRCLCNACHVTTGTRVIAYMQLVGTVCMAIAICGAVATSTTDDRVNVLRHYYEGQRGGYVSSGIQRTIHGREHGESTEGAHMSGVMDEGTFAAVFGALFLAFVIEAVIAVCLLVGVKTERRWFMLPHLITTLFALITSSMRLLTGVTVGRSDRLTSAFLTICVEFLVFWVPYRCFVYLREKERVMAHVASLQQQVPFDGAMVGRSSPNDAHNLGMAPPPSYTAAYAVPPAYKPSDDEVDKDDETSPPSYQATVSTSPDAQARVNPDAQAHPVNPESQGVAVEGIDLVETEGARRTVQQ